MRAAAEFVTSRDVTLTASTWTELVGRDAARRNLFLNYITGTAGVRIVATDNPWCLRFDGTDDYAEIIGDHLVGEDGGYVLDEDGIPIDDEGGATLPSLVSAATAGYVKVDIRMPTLAAGTIFTLCDTGGDSRLVIGIDSNYCVFAVLIVDTETQWQIDCLYPLVANQEYRIKLHHNGTNPTIHINGAVETPQAFSTSEDLTAWFKALYDSSSSVNAVYLGAGDEGAGLTNFWAGDIMRVIVTQGAGGGAQEVVHIACDEGTGAYAMDSFSGLIVEFKGDGEPAWTSKDAGEYLQQAGIGLAFDGAEVPQGSVWAYTASSAQVINVRTGSGRPPFDV
jgi:hypothetical protein